MHSPFNEGIFLGLGPLGLTMKFDSSKETINTHFTTTTITPILDLLYDARSPRTDATSNRIVSIIGIDALIAK